MGNTSLGSFRRGIDRMCSLLIPKPKKEIRKIGQGVLYLCDGQKEDCKRTNCYQNGGKCKYTEDVEHAKNFSKKEDREESPFWEDEKFEKGEK